jgi:hypothetical protein
MGNDKDRASQTGLALFSHPLIRYRSSALR